MCTGGICSTLLLLSTPCLCFRLPKSGIWVFWSLCILVVQNLQLFLVPYSFLVFSCSRKGVSRCKHCSIAAVGPRSQACLRMMVGVASRRAEFWFCKPSKVFITPTLCMQLTCLSSAFPTLRASGLHWGVHNVPQHPPSAPHHWSLCAPSFTHLTVKRRTPCPGGRLKVSTL